MNVIYKMIVLAHPNTRDSRGYFERNKDKSRSQEIPKPRVLKSLIWWS